MPATARHALRYPSLLDAPNGPLSVQQLAEDVDAQLYRAFVCTSTTRPASPPNGMIIRERDTGAFLVFDNGAWQPVGGDAFTPASAQYAANVAQSIPHSTARVIAFGVEETEDPAVERIPMGSGHGFELGVGGLWAPGATLRLAAHPSVGERRFELWAGSTLLASAGGTPDGPSHVHLTAAPRRFSAGAVIHAQIVQFTGGTRGTEVGPGGGWMRINLARVAP